MAYEALITKVTAIKPIEGSDRIQTAVVNGYQVIVGLNVHEEDLGIFLESGGALSQEMASANDMVRRRDADGNPAGGLFEENRRVKAIKLRGARSEGFFGPLSLLAFTGVNLGMLQEGQRFSTLNGHSVCEKYYTPATLRAMKRGGKAPRENVMFAKHVETDNIKKSGTEIPKGAILHISEKLHGTSHRQSHVLETQELSLTAVRRFFNRLLKKPTTETRWTHLLGSRNVILGELSATNEGFRYKALRGVSLAKGEVIYGELVGWESPGKPIMGRQDLSSLKNKALEKRFGKSITYAYGQPEGEAKFYVYRITLVNEDGYTAELSQVEVNKRAKTLGLDVVPSIETLLYDGDLDILLARLELLTNGATETPCSSLDPTHLQEGVVVRAESENGTRFYKSKAVDFLLAELGEREKEDFVDAEEVA